MSAVDDRRADRRRFLQTVAGTCLWSFSSRLAEPATAPTILYNGIREANPWPPRQRGFQQQPIVPPYLLDRPEVVPIDVGRQLFVDDFLVEETSLYRTFHRPDYHPSNPILRPDTRWEKFDEYALRTNTRSNPTAMVFSDGVFYDPRDRIFKMWYMGGYSQHTCYAWSHDGITWEKPSLDVVAGTNIAVPGIRDSSTVWLDLVDPDPRSRFKMAHWYDHYLVLHVSPDGIHWTEKGRSGLTGDRTTFFYNPFREKWVFSLRNDDGPGRYRQYLEAKDFLAGARWQKNQAVPWTSADAADPRRPDYNVPPELYNLDCVAYESLMLGLFTIFRGERTDREKPNEVCVGFSRDGFHWSRPDRRAFLPVSEQIGDWNWANVQSAGGGCLVVGDRLHFYVSGRRGYPGTSSPGTCSTGLATLRRDGFASMDHPTPRDAVERVLPTPGAGVLVTRPVRFSGRHLFVNIDAPSGDLRVEVLDREGQVLPGYELARCAAVSGNSTCARVTWQGATDLSAIAGRTVRFRFHLRRGSLYAFWVSASLSGASQGYVAAGGPGYTGLKDTTGAVALGASPPQM